MSLDTKTKSRIIKEESSRFLDSQFGGLDLSGSPDLQSVVLESFETEDKHGFHNVDVRADLSGLRKFLANPDNESLARVAEESGDPELMDRVNDVRAGSVAQEFCARHPEYLACDDNLRKIVIYLSHETTGMFFDPDEIEDGISELSHRGVWTLANIERVYQQLTSEGLLRVPANIIRKLNSHERLAVVRLAQSGDTQGALQSYLSYALNDPNPQSHIASDPSLVELCDRACLFVFSAWAADFSPTKERMAYIKQYAAGRPLTLNLIVAAWESLKAEEKGELRSKLIGLKDEPTTRQEISQGLDELDDEAVKSLYKQTRRHISRISSGAGILE